MSMSMTSFYCYRMADQMSENSIFLYDKRKFLVKNGIQKKMPGVVDSENENKILVNHTRRTHEQ